MKTEANAKVVTVYVNSTDHTGGQPLYAAIVQLCREMGIAGATVLRCDEGYGTSGRLHTTRLFDLGTNLPVRIEIIDVPERIVPFLESLSAIIGEGLVTVTDTHIFRFRHDPH
jgi:uncharacterized protein